MTPSFSQTLLWTYVTVMVAGAGVFAIMSRNQRGVPAHAYLIAIIIPLWSGAAYMAMALGQGQVPIYGQIAYYARYLDWVVTTPLLLLALALAAMFYLPKKNITIIITLVATDVFMILTGLIADFTPRPTRYTWYLLGLMALFVILYTVWMPLRKIAKSQGDALYRHYLRVAGYLTFFWFGYPTAWAIGPSGMQWVGSTTDTVLFTMLPIFSKVGFSLLDITGLRALYKLRPEPAGDPVLQPDYSQNR